MQIGFHLSVAKGFDWTLTEARRLGCEVVQIFVKNPRSWQERTFTDAQRESFARLLAAVPVYAHLSYLPNPARIDENSRNLDGMLHEASLCAELGIERLIIHCGSREDTERGMAIVARAVNEVLERNDLTIVLENAAGQGNALGRTIDELGRIYEGIERQDRVLICIDTAHIFEARYVASNRP
jgi:deoxyribonuclease-4